MTETAGQNGGAAPAPDRTTLFALHFLGGSAAEWDALIGCMDGRLRWVTLDLPGFGRAAGVGGYSVAAMADAVADAVRAERPSRWALAGHSMGAKVAAAVARRAEDGEAGLDGLARIVLLAGSPPSPEPMADDKRAEMLAWFGGDAATSATQAHGYVAANVGAALAPDLHARTVDGVLQAHRGAWVAWLTDGSREDWADRIGVLRTPALIVAGSEDEALGIDAQTRLMAPHFADAHLVVLPGAGHLLPLERPDDLAHLIDRHLDATSTREPTIPPAYGDLIRSDRVSTRTRAVLLDRAAPVAPDHAPLSAEAFAILHALVDRIVPQGQADTRIDLASRITQSLRAGEGDGWRFADLPPDAEACKAGLATLDGLAQAATGRGFATLDPGARDALLRAVAAGEAEEDAAGLTPGQMRQWFEDICAAAARAYVAHPATLARIGFSGIANGGDGPRKQGFASLGIGVREPWEPEAMGSVPR